jgi:YARHG domain
MEGQMRRSGAFGGLAGIIGLVVSTSTGLGQGQDIDRGQRQELNGLSCEQLWHERNKIFKAAGYCFKSPQAIRTFGNAGCSYDNEHDVPLSDRDRQFVIAIRHAEREKGCRT